MQKIAITAQHINDSSATSFSCIIDEDGGTIGSDSNNNLCLQDSLIQPQHVSIQYEEGSFTITSIADSDIFYNNSFSKLLAGYETTIELGDTFRIGNYHCSITDPKDLNEDIIDTKQVIKEIDSYDELDTLVVKPRGQINGMNIHAEKIEDILHENAILDDLMNITPNTLETKSLKSNNQTSLQDHVQKNTNSHNQPTTQESIVHKNQPIHAQTILTFLDNTIKNLPIHSKIPLHTNFHLSMHEIQEIIHNKQLIDSPLLLNILVLGIISKELHTPLFETLENDILETTLSYAIEEQKSGNKEYLQSLLIKALQSYLSNK